MAVSNVSTASLYHKTAPFYHKTAPFYHQTAPFYHQTAPFYHYTDQKKINLFIVATLAKIVKQKGPSSNKMYIKCSVCNTSRRYDCIAQTKPVICQPCKNRKDGKVSGKKRLRTEESQPLSDLSDHEQQSASLDEIDAQSNEMIQQQQQKLLVVQEDDLQNYRDEQRLLSQHATPSKRAKSVASIKAAPLNFTDIANSMQIDTTTSFVNTPSLISYDKALLANALQIISTSKHKVQFLSNNVLSVCHMFVNEYAVLCIQQNRCTQLIDSINLLLDGVNALPQHQMVGLLAASFVLGQSCWQSAVSALNITRQENREFLLQQFSQYMTTNYDNHMGKWFKQYWKYSTDQQIDLCKQFNSDGLESVPDVLTLSLVVQISDTKDFTEAIQHALLSRRQASSMLLDHIQKRPAQPKISLEEVQELIILLTSAKNEEIVKKHQTELEQTYIAQWLGILDAAKTTDNITDAVSIQHFLDELQSRYGELKHLMQDITQSDDDRFSLILEATELKPNNKQFALAQYCVANLYAQTRQLWVVGSGQGKARIIATIIMISLMSGAAKMIHVVFPNQYLMERDQNEFEELLMYVEDYDKKVLFHVGIDFVPEDNSLILVDEADIPMLDSPSEFKKLVQNCPCICFTATPALSKMEMTIADQLKFKQYSYSLNEAAVIDKSDSLMVDVNFVATTVEEKATHIKDLARQSPVLVYCDEVLTLAITVAGIPPVIIEGDVDYKRLRQLDQLNAQSRLFTVVVSKDTTGMRGFDYRSNLLPITLVIAQSFRNKREAIQGFNRVGRFGDRCSREKFTDVEIIDIVKEKAQSVEQFKFITILKKDQVQLKPVIVKKATTTYKSKLGAKRDDQLIGR